MRLKEEVTQGEVSDFSWNEIQQALRSGIAPAFEQFWDEVSEGLKKHGVQLAQIPEEDWCKLEPILHTIAAKVAVQHLRSRKAQVGSVATAKPTREDKASFWQSLRNAAEGWPTIKMLHFLKHLQVHASPVLESGLQFLLEVQKFKNAHHPWPDMALLKTKVLVIRDCFLASQIEPQLQVAVDTQRLGRAIRAAEQALQKEIPMPPPSLFDELKDSVFSMLLPYWAAFQKHWIKRSPESAQKAPVLRNQLLLQKRRARLERQGPPQSLQLPRGVQGSGNQDSWTYTFSVSRGLMLQ
ncbi:Regulator of G-protein signaling 22, partial [Varanus komodoensis]